MVTGYGSGRQRAVVEGLNRITLLWTDGDLSIAVDGRVWDQEKFWDSWYSGLDKLKLLYQWEGVFWLGLKSKRQGNCVSRDVGFPETARHTHREGLGWLISDRAEAGEKEVTVLYQQPGVQTR